MGNKGLDIICILDKFLGPYGYGVYAKLNNRNQRRHRFRLAFFTVVLVQQLIVHYFPYQTDYMMEVFCGTGFYMASGGIIRQNISQMGFALISLFLLPQLLHVRDDYSWLVKANQLFYQIDSIHVHRKAIQILPVLRIVNLVCSFHCLCCRLVTWYIAFGESIWNGHIRPLHYFNGLVTLHAIYLTPIYFAGMFISKLYLLLYLSAMFCTQFSRHSRRTLRKASSRKAVESIMKQYQLLFELIQLINSQIAPIFGLFNLFSLYECLLMYQAICYGDVVMGHRILAMFLATIIILPVIYFSWLAGIVQEKIKDLSTSMYYRQVLCTKCALLPKNIKVTR